MHIILEIDSWRHISAIFSSDVSNSLKWNPGDIFHEYSAQMYKTIENLLLETYFNNVERKCMKSFKINSYRHVSLNSTGIHNITENLLQETYFSNVQLIWERSKLKKHVFYDTLEALVSPKAPAMLK